MEELKKLIVEQLEKATDQNEQIRILQEINKTLLMKYVIQIGDLTIEPLLVETYYYCKEKFEDKSVHAAYSESDAPTYKLARERQKNKFGELYVHYGCKDGIDIVLSNGDYYLSILIKNALVNQEFKKQCAISETICNKCDTCSECDKGLKCKYYGENVLKKKISNIDKDIVFFARKGIKGDFADKGLAALPLDEIRKYSFTPGESATTIITNYIKGQLKIGRADEEKLKELSKGIVAWKRFGS
ncbi:MAG: hypothetical protein J1F24_04315 [Oscillospiraceae bacterium]|nr:hypothetical protein [Oscillospiraceae bacterium]